MTNPARLLAYARQRNILYTPLVLERKFDKLTPRQRRRFLKKESRNLAKMIGR